MKNEISTLNPSQCCEKIFKENGIEYTLEHFHRVYTILEENYYDEDFVKYKNSPHLILHYTQDNIVKVLVSLSA